MTRTLKSLLWVVVLVALASISAHAQSQPTITTLSSAEVAPNGCAGSQCTMVVASATGITASTKSLQQFCLVDSELQEVTSISSTTLTVRRGRQGFPAAHVSGAYVICGVTGSFDPKTGNISYVVGSPTVGASVTGATFLSSLPVGTCTRANIGILPVFVITAQPTGAGQSYGYTADCLNGKWVPGTLPEYPPQRALVAASNIPLGSVAYGSLGTDTTGVNNQEWETSIYVPQTSYVTGVKVLAGGTATTDNILALVRDQGGNILANAAAAGVLLSGANTFQTQAFTAKTLLIGPAIYTVGVQTNGTNAGDIRTVAASTFVDIYAGSNSVTFGTVTGTVTVPVTFTAGKAPIVELYY